METLSKKILADFTEDSIWIFNTPSETTESFLFYVHELGFIKALSKYYATQENISSFLIMLTLSGCGEYIIKNGTFTLSTNKLAFIDSVGPHIHKTNKHSNGSWDVLWVQSNGLTARGYWAQYKTKNLPFYQYVQTKNRHNHPQIKKQYQLSPK